MSEKRTVASLSRLERQWCKRRYCGFCDAPLLGSRCYAYSGLYALPIIEGVRDKEKVVDLGPPCDMDEARAKALRHYKPRPRDRDAAPRKAEGLEAEGQQPGPSEETASPTLKSLITLLGEVEEAILPFADQAEFTEGMASGDFITVSMPVSYYRRLRTLSIKIKDMGNG